MGSGGYIRVDRRILQSAVSSDMELLGRWVWILASVNWKSRQMIDGSMLEPGQMITSMERLANAWGCSKSSAFRGTQKMKKLGMIRTESGTLGTVVTVCNWRTYQNDQKKGGTPAARERNDPGTRRGTRAEQEEKGKKGKREKGKSVVPLELPTILDSPAFRAALESWQSYKGSAYKPRGLSALISQAAKRAESHGLQAVLNAFERAMSNGWAGWNQDSSFPAARGVDNDPRGNLALVQRMIEEGNFG